MPPIAKSSAANSTRRDYTTSCDVDDSLCENFPLITRPHRSIKRRREMCQASNCRPPKNRFPKNGKSSPAFRFVREGTPQRLNNNKNSYTSRTVRDCHVLDDGPTKKKTRVPIKTEEEASVTAQGSPSARECVGAQQALLFNKK